MAANYIPATDGEFLTWEANLLTYAGANLAALGLVAGDLTASTNIQPNWENAYLDVQAKQTALTAAVQLKGDLRVNFEAALRALVRKLQASSAVSDAERASLGITVRDSEPTPVGPPASAPVIVADTSAPGRLTINFADAGTPTKKAKPPGVMAAMLQYKKGGTAPASDADWQFLAIDSSTPYLWVLDSADSGAAVWVRACWVNSHQEQGPWSGTLSTRVPG